MTNAKFIQRHWTCDFTSRARYKFCCEYVLMLDDEHEIRVTTVREFTPCVGGDVVIEKGYGNWTLTNEKGEVLCPSDSVCQELENRKLVLDKRSKRQWPSLAEAKRLARSLAKGTT